MARAAKENSVLHEISDAIDEVVDQAEKVANRGWEVAFEVLPERAETLVDDLTKQSRKVSKDFDKRRKQTVKRVEKAFADLDKRRESLAKQAEKRLDRFLGSIEGNVSGVLRPVAKRLDLASRSEVTALKRRLTQLEKSLGQKGKPAKRRTRKSSARGKTARAA